MKAGSTDHPVVAAPVGAAADGGRSGRGIGGLGAQRSTGTSTRCVLQVCRFIRSAGRRAVSLSRGWSPVRVNAFQRGRDSLALRLGREPTRRSRHGERPRSRAGKYGTAAWPTCSAAPRTKRARAFTSINDAGIKASRRANCRRSCGARCGTIDACGFAMRIAIAKPRCGRSIRWGLVSKAGVWYLIARLSEELEMRSFRVERMRSVDELPTRFERPPEFDLERYWSDTSAQFKQSSPEDSATLRTDLDAVETVTLYWTSEIVETNADFGLVRVAFPGPEAAPFAVLAWGGKGDDRRAARTARTGRCSSTRSTRTTRALKRDAAEVGEQARDVGEETRGGGAVDDAMIVGDGAAGSGAARTPCRSRPAASWSGRAEDRDFGGVDDRRERGSADAADREIVNVPPCMSVSVSFPSRAFAASRASRGDFDQPLGRRP